MNFQEAVNKVAWRTKLLRSASENTTVSSGYVRFHLERTYDKDVGGGSKALIYLLFL